MARNLTTQKAPDIILVDGSSYLYRAYHALPALLSPDGAPTGAIKGVTAMLRRLCSDYQLATTVVVFDAKGKTFRDALYADYKKNRPPMPEDLKIQIEPLHQIIKLMGLPLISIEGVEADDTIGTLAREAAAAGRQVLISTGDKDMAQLVDERITMVNTMNQTFLDPKGVEEKFGVGPDLIIDFLALMGDSSDNIPGVPGVGEKTALVLLQNLGGLESIYQQLDRIPELPIRGAKSLPARMAEARKLAFLSYELATIKTDLDTGVDVNNIKMSPPDQNSLKEFFVKLGFKGWTQELNKAEEQEESSKIDPVATQADYEIIWTESDLDKWLVRLKNAPLVAFDTETTSQNYMAAELVGVSFAVDAGEAAYVPFGHDYEGAQKQLSRLYVLEKLKPLLEDPDLAKVGQNIKYDQSVLARAGITLRGVQYDTMLESYVLNATATRHNMDALAAVYLNYTTTSFEQVAGKGKKQLKFNQIPIEIAAPYAAEDADITLQLHQTLWPRLEEQKKLKEVFCTIELPLINVISRMERCGVLIDSEKLTDQSQLLEEQLSVLEKQAFELAGTSFNLSSPKQLQEILFSKLNLPVIKKTPKGQPSTAEEVLEELALEHELPACLLQYRGLYKLKTTYTDKLPQMKNTATGRVHTSYHQAVVATGRLSSSDPNLQNIPIRNAQGKKVRQAFIAKPGYSILAADYSQIELRIMAHLARDTGLCSAFADGKDIHCATAAEVFGVPENQVTADQRRFAKTINFGLIYGMSAFGLAKQLDIGRQEAQVYIDLYFSRYPGVKAYMESSREKARKAGYVETLFGRRLYLPDITSGNGLRRQAAERAAINAPMQGTAADLIKMSMICVDRWLCTAESAANLVMQVHDELVLEVHDSHITAVKEAVRECMENVAKLSVPLVVDIGVGKDWEEAH